jgi:hypothetical protein
VSRNESVASEIGVVREEFFGSKYDNASSLNGAPTVLNRPQYFPFVLRKMFAPME